MESSPTSSGASNAKDFQPPTGNPQQNIGGNLQPIVPSDQNDVFNQPKINSQDLPQTNTLSVVSNGTAVDLPIITNNLPDNSFGWFTPMNFMIVVVALISVLLLLAKKAKPLPTTIDPTPETQPKKPKKQKSKKKSKNRKKSRK